MRDAKRIREHSRNKSADSRSVVWLSLAGVGVLALTFTLGMFVGRRLERLANTPTETGTAIAQVDAAQAMHDELTFYDALTKPGPTEPSPAKTEVGTPPKPAPAPTPEPTPASAAANAPVEISEPSEAAKRVLQLARDDSGKEPGAVPIQQDPLALPAEPARSGEYTVQVSSFQVYEEAQAYAAGLERKGHAPFIVTADVSGKGTWHRVRIGRYTTESLAHAAKRTLAQADIPGWVLRTE